jgi:dienelactone hydrolase
MAILPSVQNTGKPIARRANKQIALMKYFLSFFLLWPTWLLFSQSPGNIIPRELLFREKDKINVTLSKDGETVFYQKTVDGSDSTLYFLHRKTPLVERSKKYNGPVVSWRPVYAGGLVAIVQEDTTLQVYFTSMKARKQRKLEVKIPFSRMKFLTLSPRFPNKVVVDVVARDSLKHGMYFLDLLSGNMRRLGIMGDLTQIFFDESFGMVAGLQPSHTGGNVLLRRVRGHWKEVFRYPFAPEMFIGGLSKIISVSLDGKTIYATDNFEKDKTTLVAIDAETGEVTELASDPDADILPYAASVDPQGRPTSVVALWGGTKRHIIDPAVEKDFDFLNNELNDNVSFVSASEDDRKWLVRTLDGGPVKYYLYDRDTPELTYLFNDYPHLDGYDLATRKAYTVTTRDSLRLPVQVYVPPGMAGADGMPKVPLPTIIYVHGGPWAGVTHWNSWFYTRNFELLANRGYVVINMEFRGTTGLGKKVCDAGDLQWGEAMHHDIVDVANWAIGSGISHKRRIGIWGWSYGGYATNYALGKSPDLFACGVSMYGITGLYEFCKLPFADSDLWRTRVGDPNTGEGAALLKKFSPSTYVKDVKAPLLLTTGTLDDRVPQEQSDTFAKALHDAGKEVVYFFYPEEGHDFRAPESWVSFWAIAEDFLHKNLAGKKQPRQGDIEKGNLTVMFGAEYVEGIE